MWYHHIVVCDKGKKWQNFLFFAYLLLAIIGSYTFSIHESFNLDKNKLNFDTYFTSFNYSVDWIAGETTTIRKASRDSSFIIRNGLIRIFLYFGVPMTAIYLTGTHMQQIKNYITSDLKDSILIKLRIWFNLFFCFYFFFSKTTIKGV